MHDGAVDGGGAPADPRGVPGDDDAAVADDVRALAGLTGLGVEGAIVGKALYAGAFTLPEALAVTREAA